MAKLNISQHGLPSPPSEFINDFDLLEDNAELGDGVAYQDSKTHFQGSLPGQITQLDMCQKPNVEKSDGLSPTSSLARVGIRDLKEYYQKDQPFCPSSTIQPEASMATNQGIEKLVCQADVATADDSQASNEHRNGIASCEYFQNSHTNSRLELDMSSGSIIKADAECNSLDIQQSVDGSPLHDTDDADGMVISAITSIKDDEVHVKSELDLVGSIDDADSPSKFKKPSSHDDSGSEPSASDDEDYHDPASEDEVSDDVKSEEEGKSHKTPKTPKDGKTKVKASRLAPAKTPREFLSRMHQREDAKNAKSNCRKRLQTVDRTGMLKKLKLGHDDGLRPLEPSDIGSIAPSLPAIQARTHAAQFAWIKENIPKDFDTRRSATQKRDLMKAVKLLGYKRIKALDSTWLHKFMKTGLRDYQLTATSWMVERELARTEPFGGLLADEMGLGKTVVSLACIVANPLEDDDTHDGTWSRATLVVVPNKSTADQWLSEAMKHCHITVKDFAVLYKPRSGFSESIWGDRRIVITTYNEVMKQYPSEKQIKEVVEDFDGDDLGHRHRIIDIMGELFHIKWYRVILDEAHAIKNLHSRTTSTCCALSSRFRWALSGTPLSNSSKELYPYLKFFGCPFTQSRRDFNKTYFYKGECNGSLDALLSLVTYRRKKCDAFIGRRIVDLPAAHTHDLWVPLSTEEQTVVDFINDWYEKKENGIRSHNNDENSDQSPAQAASAVRFTKLTKLRQGVSHVFCLETILREEIDVQEIQSLNKTLKKEGGKIPILKQLEASSKAGDDMQKYRRGLQILAQQKEDCLGGYFRINNLLTLVENEHYVRLQACGECQMEPPLDPIVSWPCEHVYCTRCLLKIVKHQREPSIVGPAHTSESQICRHLNCGEKLSVGGEIMTLNNTGIAACAKGGSAKDFNGVRITQSTDKMSFFIACSTMPEYTIPPSTKTTAAVSVILTWLKEAPSNKIIVFAQFISTMEALGHMFVKLGIQFVYYNGSTSQAKKTKALSEFKENPSVQVFLATMKCGGQALNLTEANQVIIIDQWWNNIAEEQAFGRVFRIGQDKHTRLVRIRTQSDIDERICNLQVKKSKDINRTLQDDGPLLGENDERSVERMLPQVRGQKGDTT